ncbi:hypothetical protein ColLi_05228 [Colletotrichum liriopes]|uniref:Uncharacterized protein n=1 Tax=Colletotrichum liriopes TaxID=708192 RepID=A0AA37LR73_9PEZI|nr:hypothetical protein ColLi_05228 [Colletotrichum liriopes]
MFSFGAPLSLFKGVSKGCSFSLKDIPLLPKGIPFMLKSPISPMEGSIVTLEGDCVVSLGYPRLAKGLDGGPKASKRCLVGLSLFAKKHSLAAHPGHFVFQVEDIMFFLISELPNAECQPGNGLVRLTVPFAFYMIEGI